MISNDAVVTFAIGKKYQKYALSLANSFLLYNSSNNIQFYIITDYPLNLSKKLNRKIHVVISNTVLYGEDVLLNKFQVKEYVKCKNILLIDADSFISSNLEPIFRKFENNDLVIWGNSLHKFDDWRGNSIINLKIYIDKLYKINGGVYFFGDSDITKNFFSLCNELIKNYEANGFAKVYGNHKDDEIIFSVASVLMNIELPVPDMNVKVETMYFSRRIINIFFGGSIFYNVNFRRTTIESIYAENPMIICFDRFSVNDFDYKFSSKMLNYVDDNTINRIFAAILTVIALKVYYTVKYLKWNITNLKPLN
ncbi:hypothetical protein [Pedobacter aquatilis]|uniref:hypothetical protein n=1 Tax=Pedobacter aquatilis TaxID=351343 RepID=UPI00292E489A|nr:hypothetical protein [Pedobacter aquatilis]